MCSKWKESIRGHSLSFSPEVVHYNLAERLLQDKRRSPGQVRNQTSTAYENLQQNLKLGLKKGEGCLKVEEAREKQKIEKLKKEAAKT